MLHHLYINLHKPASHPYWSSSLQELKAEMREMRSWSSAMKKMMIMVLLFLLFFGSSTVDAAVPTAAQCKLVRRALVNACDGLLYGKLPSSSCCWRIRVTPFQCVCPVITPKLAALIDVNKAISLVKGCGRRIPRHFKCGSISTP